MNSKSFTLIELLVVISVIGLLSSIVLVSLQGAKEQADISKAQEFSHAVRVSLGADLVGEWRFDDNTNDSSGYENNGATGGDPIYVEGMFGQALEFNGNDYVVIDAVADEIAGKNNLTWESWIKTTDTNDNVIGGWNDSGGNNLFWFRVHNSKFSIHDGSDHYGQKEMSDGIWHHIAVIYNNGTISTYEDGETAFTPYNKNITFSSNNKVSIGQEWDGGSVSGHFNGIIDEVHIYDKALSLAEIQQLYAQGAAKHGIVLK